MTKKEFDSLKEGDIIVAIRRDMIATVSSVRGWTGMVISKEFPYIKAKTITPNYLVNKVFEHIKYKNCKVQS